MKTIKHLFSIMCVLLAAGAFQACDDDVKYTPAEMPDNAQVYFAAESPATIDLSKEETSFTVSLLRVKTDGALNVPLNVLGGEGVFTIPTSASFAEGEDSTDIVITYDPSKLEYDQYTDITLSINDASLTTPYGISIYTFKAGIPAPWTTLCEAVFNDAFVMDADTIHVELQQNDLQPNQYRVVNPYGKYYEKIEYSDSNADAPAEYVTFTVMEPGNTQGDVTITQEGLLYFEPYSTGLYQTDGANYAETVYCYHPGSFNNYQSESNWLHNRVLHYNEDGEPDAFQLAPYYYMAQSGYGADNTQADGVITIMSPGVVIADYSASVDYMGRFTDVSETNYAVASVTLGADVENARVAMIEGTDIDGALVAIEDGSADYQEITASGNLNFEVEADGTYSFIVLAYAEGEVQTTATTSFEFTTAGGSQWNTLGTGLYTDDYIASVYNVGGNYTVEVEVQESAETPGLYRLKNPYAEFGAAGIGNYDDSRNYFMEINASDPEGVYIPLQNIGLDLGYGFFYVYSYAAYYLDGGESLENIKAAGMCGTLADGVITFPTKTLLALEESDPGSIFYANANGAFRLVLPEAVAEQAQTRSAQPSMSLHKPASVNKIRTQAMDRQQRVRTEMKKVQMR